MLDFLIKYRHKEIAEIKRARLATLKRSSAPYEKNSIVYFLNSHLIVILEIDLHGFGPLRLKYLLSDYYGTLALNGNLPLQVQKKLSAIIDSLCIFDLISQEFGKTKDELRDVNCTLHIFEEKNMGT